MGRLHYSGEFVGKADFVKAFDWFSKAAKQEHAAANWAIGYMYEYGSGRDKKAKEEFTWYLKSAEFGYKNAQVSVAGMYISGIGVDKDAEKSFDWYLQAALSRRFMGSSTC
jgi:TPR repeat protein